jgi:hypothetical protein
MRFGSWFSACQACALVSLRTSAYPWDMSANHYKFLAPKPKSVYKQLFIRDRWISARTVWQVRARRIADDA